MCGTSAKELLAVMKNVGSGCPYQFLSFCGFEIEFQGIRGTVDLTVNDITSSCNSWVDCNTRTEAFKRAVPNKS